MVASPVKPQPPPGAPGNPRKKRETNEDSYFNSIMPSDSAFSAVTTDSSAELESGGGRRLNRSLTILPATLSSSGSSEEDEATLETHTEEQMDEINEAKAAKKAKKAEKKAAKLEKRTRHASLSAHADDMREKAAVRKEGSWEFKEGETPEERRVRLYLHDEEQRIRSMTPEGEKRYLMCSVLECSNLKRMDGYFGNNDVFTEVYVAQPDQHPCDPQKTQVLFEAGVSPKWAGFDEDKEAHNLIFDLPAKGKIGDVRVRVFDWDRTVNEMIGEVMVTKLPECGEKDWSVCAWHTLLEDKGDGKTKRCGRVRLYFRWARPLTEKNGGALSFSSPVCVRISESHECLVSGADPREWNLNATVIACKDLKSVDLGALPGTNDSILHGLSFVCARVLR